MATQEERDYLSQYIDISGSRLSGDDVQLLMNFINSVGNTAKKTRSYSSWYSGGRYSGTETDVYVIEDDYTISHYNSYADDDGDKGSCTQSYSNAREIINILKEVPDLL